jgi:PilX N-terminal
VKAKKDTQSGIALIITLLAMTIFALIMVGFFYMVIGEQQISSSDHDNTIAFYGAEGALENMSSQVAELFAHTASPTPAQLAALESEAPTFPTVTFPATSSDYPNGGYYVGYTSNGSGGIASTNETIGGTGPLAGLQGTITPLTLTAIADGPNHTEVKLVRQVQEVAVPVFEFGIFSNGDLSFFAGPNFQFGGRVATNGNLFLAEGSGSTLTFPAKVTAYENVIRTQLANGYSTSSAYPGTVDIVTTPGSYRGLAQNEGSLTGGPGSSANPNWNTISLTDYNGNVETAATGVKQLNLSIAFQGAAPISIIERAQSSDTSLLSQARLENQASMRILLSDSTADLPDGANAVSLGAALGSWYTVDSCHAPLAESAGPVQGTYPNSPWTKFQDNDFLTPAGTYLLGGYIEIDIQNSSGSWTNVTQEVLKQGITPASSMASSCTNKPVIHLEELNPYACNSSQGHCVSRSSGADGRGSTNAYDYIPINMYDTREGNARDVNDGTIHLGGVMNLVEVDVGNLQNWFANDSSGQTAWNNAGYTVYFSDRRGNFDPGVGETGMYGNEDIINPASSTGAPDGVMEEAEDVDGSNANTSNWSTDTFDTYGSKPSCSYTSSPVYPCVSSSPYSSSATTQTSLNYLTQAGIAEKNAVIFFRRALRLVDGSLGSLPPLNTANCSVAQGASGSGGFTVAAENPVYILGNYNANSAGGSSFNDQAGSSQCHVPSSVMGDAVTLLSNSWTDVESFTSPTLSSGRSAGSSPTYYRTAIMGGTTVPFQQPTGYTTYQDFGTDGGVHNFLRMLEDWGSTTLYYKGSIADFYYSRQATGVYKDGLVNSVYAPPSRGYSFDLDFESIATLPPSTPRFTDVNALGFQQELLATQ